MQLRQANPRRQGDIREGIAAAWLIQQGYGLWIPFGHSPDVDLIAQDGHELLRVQVKTTTLFRKERWEVTLCTRGGNQSWNGLVKHLDSSTYDFLFVVAGDWRCWFIPSAAVEARSGLRLGGPKYAAYEVSPGAPDLDSAPLNSPSAPGGSAGVGEPGRPVKSVAMPE
jgi:PD-(D/E)XK endonuclease